MEKILEPLSMPEEEMGLAVLKACRIVARKRCFGSPERQREFADALVLDVWKRARKYKPGKKTLDEFCYVSAYFAATDLWRKAQENRDILMGFYERRLFGTRKTTDPLAAKHWPAVYDIYETDISVPPQEFSEEREPVRPAPTVPVKVRKCARKARQLEGVCA